MAFETPHSSPSDGSEERPKKAPADDRKRATTREANKERRKRESADRVQEEAQLNTIEKQIDASGNPAESRKSQAQAWLTAMSGDLTFDGDRLELGEPVRIARSGGEQYGLYVDGKHVGDIRAGFRWGQTVSDTDKFEYSSWDRTNPNSSGPAYFKEAGLKAQLQELADWLAYKKKGGQK